MPENALAQTTYKPYQATDALLPSGLLVPVRVKTSRSDSPAGCARDEVDVGRDAARE